MKISNDTMCPTVEININNYIMDGNCVDDDHW